MSETQKNLPRTPDAPQTAFKETTNPSSLPGLVGRYKAWLLFAAGCVTGSGATCVVNNLDVDVKWNEQGVEGKENASDDDLTPEEKTQIDLDNKEKARLETEAIHRAADLEDSTDSDKVRGSKWVTDPEKYEDKSKEKYNEEKNEKSRKARVGAPRPSTLPDSERFAPRRKFNGAILGPGPGFKHKDSKLWPNQGSKPNLVDYNLDYDPRLDYNPDDGGIYIPPEARP